jgi:hypothetical protein
MKSAVWKLFVYAYLKSMKKVGGHSMGKEVPVILTGWWTGKEIS